MSHYRRHYQGPAGHLRELPGDKNKKRSMSFRQNGRAGFDKKVEKKITLEPEEKTMIKSGLEARVSISFCFVSDGAPACGSCSTHTPFGIVRPPPVGGYGTADCSYCRLKHLHVCSRKTIVLPLAEYYRSTFNTAVVCF